MTVLKRLMRTTLVIALAGICVEVIMYVSGTAPTQNLSSVDLATYEQVPGIWEPGLDFNWSYNQPLPHYIKTNSLGYRGAEFPRAKSPHELRVLMVGDSFTFGSNVSETETMPDGVRQLLANSCENEHLSIINAGIPGSSIKSQSEMIRRGMQLNPDVIVLVFNESDVNDMADPLWDHMTNNRNTKAQFPLSLVWPVLRKTLTWGLISSLRETLSTRVITENREESDQLDIDRGNYKIAYLEELKSLASQVEAGGSTFMIVTYPTYRATLDTPENDSLQWAMQEFPKLGIPHIDLLEPFQRAFSKDVESAYLIPDDGHPSKLGHQFAGTSIAKWLLSQPPLQNDCVLKKAVSLSGSK